MRHEEPGGDDLGDEVMAELGAAGGGYAAKRQKRAEAEKKKSREKKGGGWCGGVRHVKW